MRPPQGMEARMTPAQRKAWLEARRKGLGSTDAAVVLDRSPWMSRFELHLDKTGQLPLDRFEEINAYQEWGNRLELAIAEAYADREGVELIEPELQVSREHPWMLATVDRIRDDGRIVELKTSATREG